MAGALVRSLEEAAAIGDVASWSLTDADVQTRLQALVMAAHHQRLDVIDALGAVGAPIDEGDEVFGRHPLSLAAGAGRPESVRDLLRRAQIQHAATL